MTLAVGAKLGPYEILAPLGAGGMGEVYKARDTRLDRLVALKVLPADFASDPQRRARFEREAKTISQLNHPHICTLYDVGDGSSSEAERSSRPPYLVMEYLEGHTLAHRLAKGPVPLAQALDYATQIADALAAAHKHGVIHRDLKPSNIMLARTGSSGPPTVKLLDFGLAKVVEPGVAPGKTTTGATDTDSLTGEGRIVGTLPYMAPEQLEGKPADARTDLWAFGCVLYEMLAGRRAFEDDTSASLTSAIMRAEPPALATQQPLTPPALERLVRRCLAKIPDDRWDSAHDVADELRWIADDWRTSQTNAAGVATARAALPGPAWRWGFAVLVLAGVATAGGALTWFVLGPRVAPAPAVRHPLVDVRPAAVLKSGNPYERNPITSRNRPSQKVIALTPDGRWLVFAGGEGTRQQLYARDLSEDEAKPLPNTEGADAVFLSPDGAWVGFWSEAASGGGLLKKVPLHGGGPAVEICKTADSTFGTSWGDNGYIVFADGEASGLFRVNSGGGTPEAITTPAPGEHGHRLPHVLPGSQAVLFTVVEQSWNWETARVVMHRFGTKEWRLIVPGAADARYLPTGHLIYFRRGRLMAAPYDLTTAKRTGDEVGLLANVMQATSGVNSNLDSGAAQVAVSLTGTLAFVPGGEVRDIERQISWVDRQGRVEPLAVPPRPYYLPRLSPNGRFVAVQTLQSERRLWIHDLRIPGSLAPATSPEVGAWNPVWTRDGLRLVFSGYDAGGQGTFWTKADGTLSSERLGSTIGRQLPASWTPDGRLVFLRLQANTSYDIWELFRDDGTWRGRALLDSKAGEWDAQVSPDGRWLAYSSDESGRREVYVRPFPSLNQRYLVSSEGARSPVWARDGRELFYLSGLDMDKMELVAHAVAADGAIAPTGRALFRLAPLRLPAYWPVPGYDVTPDGRRFLFTRYPDTLAPPAPTQIQVVLNWFEELRAKVPSK